MAKQTSTPEFKFAILRIKDLKFNVNEHFFIPNKSVQINLLQTLGFNAPSETVNLTLDAFMHYTDGKPEETVIEISVQNLFKIENLSAFITDNNQLKLPPEAIITLTSLSISHTRALLAKNTSGTAFQDTLLPIMNPVEVAQSLSPTMFEVNNKQIENVASELKPKKKVIKRK